jgi:hypothetical protein
VSEDVSITDSQSDDSQAHKIYERQRKLYSSEISSTALVFAEWCIEFVRNIVETAGENPDEVPQLQSVLIPMFDQVIVEDAPYFCLQDCLACLNTLVLYRPGFATKSPIPASLWSYFLKLSQVASQCCPECVLTM